MAVESKSNRSCDHRVTRRLCTETQSRTISSHATVRSPDFRDGLLGAAMTSGVHKIFKLIRRLKVRWRRMSSPKLLFSATRYRPKVAGTAVATVLSADYAPCQRGSVRILIIPVRRSLFVRFRQACQNFYGTSRAYCNRRAQPEWVESRQWLKWFCEAGGSPDEARLEQTPYPFQSH